MADRLVVVSKSVSCASPSSSVSSTSGDVVGKPADALVGYDDGWLVSRGVAVGD
eukprot:CAMPEP_0197056776 /NCGR_PEP_ID=MMETSP1384-20130603/89257_1 /TAXON_ID=29189 /ORGANISM="Ammonia sp." /LENGTH=53 /DNA_ID=CAMNT_0042490923 /DNA_START=233 /DNA_END=391 /DNA_ORIENTATION=-